MKLEYEEFVKKYGSFFKEELAENDFIFLSSYIQNCVDDTFDYYRINANSAAFCDFVMSYLLSKHTAEDILNNGYEEDIENIIMQVCKKKNIKFEEDLTPIAVSKNEPKDKTLEYIKGKVNGYRHLFRQGMDTTKYADYIKEFLLMSGRYDESYIPKGIADEKIISYLASGTLGVKFNDEYLEMKEVVAHHVQNIFAFNRRNKDLNAQSYDFEYQYYNDHEIYSNIIFKVTSELVREGKTANEVANDKYLTNRIVSEIKGDMIRINSCRVKPDTIFDSYRKLSPEQKADRREFAKKFAIAMAIFYSIVAVSTLCYNVRQKHEEKQKEDNKPKHSYSSTSSYSASKAANNFLAQYDYDNNEVILGGAHK